MLKKLSAYPRQNGLAKALREIGRIERTLFTLDWIKNPTSAAAPISGSTRAKRATRWPVPSISAGSARSATAALRASSSAPPGSTVGRGRHPLEHEVPGDGRHGAAAAGRDDQRGPV